ncbi:MAG: hypothetical protein ACK4GN_00685 [Runella sp.]
MKTIKLCSPKTGFICISLLSVLMTASPVWAARFQNLEKRKSVIKIFDANPKDHLLIDNQFGLVKINLWDKNEVRVDITITAKATTATRLQEYLDAVEITDQRTGDQISILTKLNRSMGGVLNNWSWKSSDDSKNFVQIDYQVSMPKNMALHVKNRFGTTDIPMFRAPLTVMSQYGGFVANELVGSRNDIAVSYGKAQIQQLDNGKLDIAYSTLDLDNARVLSINNRFGKLKIGQVEKLDGKIGYSGGNIGTLKGTCTLKLDFSGGFRIEQVAPSAEMIDILANYSSLTMPADNNDCQFDITVTHGGFRYPNDRRVNFIQNDDQRENDPQRGPRFTKQYIGTIGKGNGPKVKVVAKYGDVSLR